MPKINVRTGMPSVQLSKEEFARGFRDRFYVRRSRALRQTSAKSSTERGFVDPSFELPIEWLETRRRAR
jgi:hypothetical protein